MVYASGDAKLTEVLLSNMPQVRGEGFIIHAYIDSNHAGDSLIRQSYTGYFVYLNSALICWHSKKQTLVEASSFRSKCMAMKHVTEYIRGLRY